jgi:hypothetical protein
MFSLVVKKKPGNHDQGPHIPRPHSPTNDQYITNPTTYSNMHKPPTQRGAINTSFFLFVFRPTKQIVLCSYIIFQKKQRHNKIICLASFIPAISPATNLCVYVTYVIRDLCLVIQRICNGCETKREQVEPIKVIVFSFVLAAVVFVVVQIYVTHTQIRTQSHTTASSPIFQQTYLYPEFS